MMRGSLSGKIQSGHPKHEELENLLRMIKKELQFLRGEM